MNNQQETTVNSDNEEWRPVNDFEGFYEVSNLGNVRSLYHKRAYWRTGSDYLGPRLLKPAPNGSLYKTVRLSLYPKPPKTYVVHRLVATAFIENSENKPQINHKNGIRTDNRVSNLEWCSAKENAMHSTSVLLKNIAQLNGFSKLTNDQVIQMRADRKSGYSLKQLVAKYSVSIRTITGICNNHTWKSVK